MPKYFFDCHLDGFVHKDAFGADLAYEDVADSAFQVALELFKEADIAKKTAEVMIKVRDHDGAEIYALDSRLTGAYTTRDGAVRSAQRR